MMLKVSTTEVLASKMAAKQADWPFDISKKHVKRPDDLMSSVQKLQRHAAASTLRLLALGAQLKTNYDRAYV